MNSECEKTFLMTRKFVITENNYIDIKIFDILIGLNEIVLNWETLSKKKKTDIIYEIELNQNLL